MFVFLITTSPCVKRGAMSVILIHLFERVNNDIQNMSISWSFHSFLKQKMLMQKVIGILVTDSQELVSQSS